MAEVALEAAATDENDDNWLYGDPNAEQGDQESGETQDSAAKSGQHDRDKEGEQQDENDTANDDSHFNDEHFGEVQGTEGIGDTDRNGDGDSQKNGDSDSDDSDDVQVTIGEIKSGPQAYPSLNIKRGGLVQLGSADKQQKSTGGKFTVEDLEGAGSINGVPALEYNIDTIEDKPWNKPGADISDYFNYGFTEATWRAYCERQRRLRVNEAGVGMHQGQQRPQHINQDMRRQGMMMNDGMQQPMMNSIPVRENTIQVMTADRREYSRGKYGEMGPPPGEQPYFPPQDPYYGAPPHQPYQESWGHSEPAGGWAPTEIKELTPGPGPMGPPPVGMGPPPGMGSMPGIGPPHMGHPGIGPPPHMMSGPSYRPQMQHLGPPMHERDRDRERERDRERDRDRERERDRERTREREESVRRERDRDRDRREEDDREERDRERSRSIKPDRERPREKSHRRERSRSRSRRHKSRSRSPRLRERDRERDRDRERSVSVKPSKSKESRKEKEPEEGGTP